MLTPEQQRLRRQAFIRTVVALAGDIAVGLVFAALCSWIINMAALGIFTSFLVWLVLAFACLAISQYVVHPSVNFMLSGHKLDDALRSVTGLAELFTLLGSRNSHRIWTALREGLGGLGGLVRRFNAAT